MGMGAMHQPLSCILAISSFLIHIFLASAAVMTSPRVTAARDLRRCVQMHLPSQATGPESVAFDGVGGGPYTGISDGRVLKWRPETLRWEEFATPPRPHLRSEWCNANYGTLNESACGRPLGLQFHKATGNLYIADAYFGLLVIGPAGGVATSVATVSNNVPFRFTNGVDIDQENGVVYFTDSSTHYQRRDFLMCVISGDATGRLLRYDPRTKSLAVLLNGLAFPNGVVLSRDGDFLLVAETSHSRVLRYWLRGPRAGASEVFVKLPGFPDNIKWNSRGELWVALNMADPRATLWNPFECPVAARVRADGQVVEVVNDCLGVGAVSEVEERNGTLWFGSVQRPYLGACER